LSNTVNGGWLRKLTRNARPFPRDQVDRFIEVTLDACPECGGALHEHEEVVIKQQIEIVEKPYIVKAYHIHTYTVPPVRGSGRRNTSDL
jgi:transposase